MSLKMKLFQLILLLISFIATHECAVIRVNDSDEYRLRRELFMVNDVMVRPVLSYSAVLNVSFSLIVNKLMDLDNKRQVLTTNVWVSQKWHNPFLTWNEEDYGGINRIQVSPTEIWVPDIILYNNGDKQVLQAGHTEFFKSWVALYSNGTCLWDSPAIVESRCDVDVGSFPFDTQECHLIFASGTYDSKLLDIHSMRSGNEVHEITTTNNTGDWEIEDVLENIRRQPIQRQPGLAQEYAMVRYTLVMHRKSLYYVMYLILPCVLCTLLVLFSFSIPPENGERIGFCSTIMVAVSVYLLLIADLLPEKSDTLPILGLYYSMTMVEIALALMATILVLSAYHSTADPPACIKALYKMCKDNKKKRNRDRKGDGKIKKWFKRNVVGNEMTEVRSAASTIPQPAVLVDQTQSMTAIVDNDETNEIDACKYETSEIDDRKIWRSIAVSCDRAFFWLFLLAFIVSTGLLIQYRPVLEIRF